MKLETRTFDLYAKVLAIAFAAVICLCAPFRCHPSFQMSKSLIGLLLEVYMPSCIVKPQLVRATILDLKAKAAAIALFCCFARLFRLQAFFQTWKIIHWLET